MDWEGTFEVIHHAINSVIMFKQTLKPTIVKKYSVPAREFTAGTANLIGSPKDIGMSPDKLASVIAVDRFHSVSSSHGFLYSVQFYSASEKVYFVTNITQQLGFYLIWQEYI